MKSIGAKFVWGSDPSVMDPPPLEGFPEGRMKIRIRPDELVTVFVVSKSVARHFLVTEKDGKWTPGWEVAKSITIHPSDTTATDEGEEEIHG